MGHSCRPRPGWLDAGEGAGEAASRDLGPRRDAGGAEAARAAHGDSEGRLPAFGGDEG